MLWTTALRARPFYVRMSRLDLVPSQAQVYGFDSAHIHSHTRSVRFSKTISRCRGSDEAIALFKEMCKESGGASTFAANAAMGVCVKHGRWGDAVKLFESLPSLNLHPDASSYNITMNAFCRSKQIDKALDLFNSMPAGLTSSGDLFTHNTLLNCLSKAGRLEQALLVLRELPDKGLHPDLYSFNIAIDACARRGRYREAEHLFQEMIHAELSPCVVTFTSVINAFARQKKWRDALRILKSMKKHGVFPTVVTLNSVMSSFERTGEWERAIGLLEDMVGNAKFPAPDVQTFAIAISACAKGGREIEALTLLESMGHVNLKPNLVCYNSALNACAKRGSWEAAKRLLVDFVETPDATSFGLAISACAKAGKADEAVGLYKSMLQQGVEPDMIVRNALMGAFSVEHDATSALNFIADMKAQGLFPDAMLMNTVLSILSRRGDYTTVFELYDSMCCDGPFPDEATYNIVVYALDAHGESGKATDVIDKARVEGHYKKMFLSSYVIDFHGAYLPIACAIMRSILRDFETEAIKPADLQLIVGKGTHSTRQPVLPGAIKKTILEHTGVLVAAVSDNPGRVVLKESDLKKWLIGLKTRVVEPAK